MNPTANEHLELGKQKFFKYDREGALDEFRLALSINSNNPNILGWIAISFVVLERFEEAEKYLEKVQNGSSPEINIAKGTISYFNTLFLRKQEPYQLFSANTGGFYSENVTKITG